MYSVRAALCPCPYNIINMHLHTAPHVSCHRPALSSGLSVCFRLLLSIIRHYFSLPLFMSLLIFSTYLHPSSLCPTTEDFCFLLPPIVPLPRACHLQPISIFASTFLYTPPAPVFFAGNKIN